MVPLALVAVGFVIYAVPPYLGLDPARARLQPMPDSPVFYPLLVTHIFLGSVALLTACLQVWPWLRRRRPQVHRWSGRIYVAVTVPAALCVIVIAPMTLYGPNQRVANTMLGLLWLITTLAGYRAVRQRRFADHRAWMLRSVALAFSIVANRFWLVAIFVVFIPEIYQGAEISSAQLDQAVGLASWLSWVVNLLAVEWWLHRRPCVGQRIASSSTLPIAIAVPRRCRPRSRSRSMTRASSTVPRGDKEASRPITAS